jgi:hypothetical protein
VNSENISLIKKLENHLTSKWTGRIDLQLESEGRKKDSELMIRQRLISFNLPLQIFFLFRKKYYARSAEAGKKAKKAQAN